MIFVNLSIFRFVHIYFRKYFVSLISSKILSFGYKNKSKFILYFSHLIVSL